MDGRTLALPMRSAKVSLESDRPFTGVYHVTYHVYDALAAPRIITLPDGRKSADFSQVYGRLAESFERNADFSKWTVRLRKGVKSHAGNELSAEDVIWSYQRVFALRAIGMWRSSVLAGVQLVDGVKAVDRYTVEFTIDGANPVFPSFLCYGTQAIVDSTEALRHATADDPWAGAYLAGTPCGYGGWDLEGRDEKTLTLSPRKEFYRGSPPVDRVVYHGVSDREDGLAMFERGDLNAVVGLYPDEVRRLAEVSGTKFMYGRTNHATIEMDDSRPPFNNRDVREAVIRTVPYDRIIKEAYFGLAERQRGIYQPNTPGFTEAGWAYEPDLELSRRLVKEAGAVGSNVSFAIVRSAESERIAGILAEALAEIGLNVIRTYMTDAKPDSLPEMYLRDDCSHGIANRHYDLAIDFAPPRDMPNRTFAGRRLSARLKQIRQSPASEHERLYRETQEELLADAACVPLAGHTYAIAYNGNLDPWFWSEDYLPLNSLLWSAARYVMPPAR